MSAAAFLIRDGRVPGSRITVIERLELPGGALRKSRDRQANRRSEQYHPLLDIRPQEQAEPADPGADRDSD